MEVKYVLYFDKMAFVNVLHIGELVKDSPKTLKIKSCEFGPCYRERLNKDYDRYKIVTKEQAREAFFYFTLIYKQYNAVRTSVGEAFKKNTMSVFDACNDSNK